MKCYCNSGHALVEPGVYRYKRNGKDKYYCKECHRIAAMKSYRIKNLEIKKTGGIPHQFCKHGHELVGNNAIQLFKKDGKKNGHRCRACHQAHDRRYNVSHPEIKYRGRMKHQLSMLYNITIEGRDALLASQENRCAVCGTNECDWGQGFNNTWHIDHDHTKPGTHRGILCARCNLLLGKLGDNKEYIQKFIDYLDKWG